MDFDAAPRALQDAALFSAYDAMRRGFCPDGSLDAPIMLPAGSRKPLRCVVDGEEIFSCGSVTSYAIREGA